MCKIVERGYVATDARDFSGTSLRQIQRAQRDILYLIDQGYDLMRSTTFIGDHHQLTARQRTALVRCTSRTQIVSARRQRQITAGVNGQTVYLDGFNCIITLETALSQGTTLLLGMDGTLRDLCGLRGTYRIIDKTKPAIDLLGQALLEYQAGQAVFYLDAPVSNSGRLAHLIRQQMQEIGLETQVILVPYADKELYDKANVVTTDGVILERADSWLNVVRECVNAHLPWRPVVPLTAAPLPQGENIP